MNVISGTGGLLLGAALMAGCADRSTPTQALINASITSPRQLDGNGHPNVGALWRDWNGNGIMEPANLEGPCSGSLIAPTVYLTAGHCLPPDPPGQHIPVRVSFDAQVLPSDQATWIEATGFVVDPEFNPVSQDHDQGVVFLPKRATKSLTPVRLPTDGWLDQLAENGGLLGQEFLKVGYGVVPTWEGAPTSFSQPGIRETASESFRSLSARWLSLLINVDATGEGGTCFWDSGSPQFLGDVVVALTSNLSDPNCRALNFDWRLDTPEAREFLGKYVPLP